MLTRTKWLPALVLATSALSRPAAATAVANANPGLPLSFEENNGQADTPVRYLARGRTATLLLARDQVLLGLHPGPAGSTGAVVRMEILGAQATPCVEAGEELPGRVSYLRGSDSERWVKGAATYGQVRYEEVYPGIDLVFHGNEGQLEYDFVVKPGADPAAIRVRFAGADTLRLEPAGDLILSAGGHEVVQRAPVSYQVADAGRTPVASRLVLRGDELGFEVGNYDASRELVIDPVLGFSSFLGGSSDDEGRDVEVDASGNVYLTGGTASVNFPITAGAFDTTLGGYDAFIAKLDPTGSVLIYATYLGGVTSSEKGLDIEADASGNAYVSGRTGSSDFPTTPGAFDATLGGTYDYFVAKLDPTGSSLVYSTYLGGSGSEDAYELGLAVDAGGNAFVGGSTSSADFPTTAGAWDRTLTGSSDGVVAKLNPSGSGLVYSTYLGGNSADAAQDIAVDASGVAYVCGWTTSTKFPVTTSAYDRRLDGAQDAFVSKLNAAGSALVYSTYLGGVECSMCAEEARRVALDSAGAAIVAGKTSASNFPTTSGAHDRTYNGGGDIFVTKLNTAGSGLIWSTFVGGSSPDETWGLALDSAGAPFVSGRTNSIDFPTTADALDPTGDGFDSVVARLGAAGSQLLYASYLGGALQDRANQCEYRSATNSLYVVGMTDSEDFPTTPGALQSTFQGGLSDGFFLRLDF